MFWRDVCVAFRESPAIFFLVEDTVVDDAGYDGEGDANADGDEGEAVLGRGEVVGWALEDVWECGEEHEEHAEDEGGIQGEEHDWRLNDVS